MPDQPQPISKYVTFKREEFTQWMNSVASGLDFGDLREVPDAVVIRLQDVFASSALFAYANSIRTTVEILQGSGYDRSVIDRLNEIADYFVTRAEEATKFDGKVPD